MLTSFGADEILDLLAEVVNGYVRALCVVVLEGYVEVFRLKRLQVRISTRSGRGKETGVANLQLSFKILQTRARKTFTERHPKHFVVVDSQRHGEARQQKT